jgi:hypothetical protein
MKFGVLDPRPIPAAEEANAALLGPQTLGVEVTIPALAARCGLGNIDPQHTGGDASCAAIEEALTAALPPGDAVLVTVRADLDSVGAMALLAGRVAGSGEFSPEFLNRVRLVAESDRFARGGWSGPRPLPTPDNPAVGEDSVLAAIAAAVADFKTPIADRVSAMGYWLVVGDEPAGYRERWLAEQTEIATALANGAIKATTAAEGKLAVVESQHRAATFIGYRLAPVVVALNPAFRFQGGEAHRKFTVCQFTPGWVNLKAAGAELAAMETGWGGSPTIVGSPQGAGSILTTEQVVEVVAWHLLK